MFRLHENDQSVANTVIVLFCFLSSVTRCSVGTNASIKTMFDKCTQFEPFEANRASTDHFCRHEI
jgi:hypothetical protein